MGGMTLKRINEAAGTSYTRWHQVVDAVEEKEQPVQQWHPQIHRRFAEQDGRKPSDFTWLNYPVSDISIEDGVAWQSRSPWNLVYKGRMPADTPQVNHYVKAEERLPDKEYREQQFGKETWYEELVTGSAISRVKFSLIDLADFEVLHEVNTDHIDGELYTGMTEATGDLIWERLTPGTTLRVRLEAVPLFFPYCNPETGDGSNHLSLVNNGYLGGEVAYSGEYNLTMTPDGLPEPPHIVLEEA